MEWYQLKTALTAVTGVSQDALHVLAGVFIQLVLAAILRLRLSHIAPWLVVFLMAAANEWSDLQLDMWPDRAQQWGETIKDMLVTMALPTLFMLLARWAPGIFVKPAITAAGSSPSPTDRR